MANAASVVDQFKGLPMETLIGAPLKAACDSQVQLAQATADFIKQVGQLEDGKARMSEFRYKRPTYDANGIQSGSEESVAQMKEEETILLSTYCILYVL